MKHGTTTLIGLLSALLLAALVAAAFYLKSGRDFQVRADRLELSLEENQGLMTGLEKKVTGLETDYQEVLQLAKEAEFEAAQLADRLHEYDLDLQGLRSRLTVATNELQQAHLVEQRLQQTLVQINADKQKSGQEVTDLKKRVVELLKEKDEILKKAPGTVGRPSVIQVEYQKLGLSPIEIRAALAELKAFREQSGAKPGQPVPPITVPKPITVPRPVTPPAAPTGNPTGVVGQIRTIIPKFGSLLIDIGVPHGVKAGDKFLVKRNGLVIGRLDARSVQGSITTCDITPNSTTMPLMVGDRVELVR